MSLPDKSTTNPIAITQTPSIADEEQQLKHVATKDVDAAWQFIQNAAPSDTVIDDGKLLRKLDWMLMPLMFACYFLQYSDKTLCTFGNLRVCTIC